MRQRKSGKTIPLNLTEAGSHSYLKHRLATGGGGGVLPYKRLMGMLSKKGSHFHDWINYNGVAFSIELLE